MISPARQASFAILSRIENRGVFSDDALNGPAVSRMESRDRNLATEIVYGTLRWQSCLDHILAGVSSRPWKDVEPDVRILLRMSLYQMWRMTRIPDHALVNDAVEIGKQHLKRGVDRYLNGVLRRLARSRPWEEARTLSETPEWIQASLPQWLWERWKTRYGGDGAKRFALSLNIPPNTALRLEPAFDRSALPFSVYPSDIVPGAYFRSSESDAGNTGGAVSLPYQDEASQLIPHLLGDIRGWRLWDACAAPGGKTAILCRNCGDNGRVYASDRSWKRLQDLLRAMKGIMPGRVEVFAADAGMGAPFRRRLDAAIADVPCSGLGTLRRNPEIKWRFQESGFPLLQETQLRILLSVSDSVRSGGKLLYSTCSTEPEENERVVEAFLSRNPDFSIERPVVPEGIQAWIGKDDMIRTFPGTRLWDGMFAAVLVRRA